MSSRKKRRTSEGDHPLDSPWPRRKSPEQADKAPTSCAITGPLFVLVLTLYVMTASGHLFMSDAWTSLDTAQSIVTRGALDIEYKPGWAGATGVDGKFYGKFGPAVVAHMLVPSSVGDRLAAAFSDPVARRVARGLPASFINCLFAAWTVALFAALAIRLGASASAAVGAALTLAFATFLWPHSRFDGSEPAQCALILWALVETGLGGCVRPWRAGFAWGWAFLIKPTTALAWPVALWLAWRSPRGALTTAALFSRGAVGPILALAFTAFYNHVRFGSPWSTGYSAQVQGAVIPVEIGLYGLLFSAGKGVLWYSPALLLGFLGWRDFETRWPVAARTGLVLWLVHLLFFAVQQNWDGDWCWGPRYLLVVVPLAMLWAVPLFETTSSFSRWKLRLCVALGVAVQVLGVAIDPSDGIRWLSSHQTRIGPPIAPTTSPRIPLHPHHFNPDLSPLRVHGYLLRQALGGPVQPLVLPSSAEETSDAREHRLEPWVTLSAPQERPHLDLWVVTFMVLSAGTRWAWVAPTLFLALGLVALRARRRLRKAVAAARVPSARA